jgi:hypothetical protein
MTKPAVWAKAWEGRLKPWHRAPGQQILCIECLEHRIGRQLVADDFASVPINDARDLPVSARLAARLRQSAP